MQRRNSDKRKQRRGAVAVMVMVMLPVLVGFAAMTFDVGTLYNTKGDMQGVADSAALASVTVLAYADANGNAVPQAIDAAVHATSDNLVMGRTLSLEAETDIVLGQSVYDAFANSYVFTPGATPTNAVRVTVRHTADSPNGSAPLYFASIFGSAGVDLTSSAVAMFVSTDYREVDCNDTAPGMTVMCHWGDRDDSDDSQGIYGPPDSDDSDDSENGDSDDSQGEFDSDSGRHDSESSDGTDSDGPFTILVDTVSLPYFLQRGDELGPCPCVPGDSDDSDDSQGEFGPPDSDDSDDSDSGDSDGSSNGDSDDSDDSQGEFGPPDSDDSDDSDSGDSDGSTNGDSDDSDDSQGEFGPPDSDDSDDSDASDDSDGGLVEPGQVTICHYPPGNPANMHTLSIGAPAVPAHLAHGDTQGPCPADAKLLIFLVE